MRPEEGEGVSYVEIWKKRVPVEERAGPKTPVWTFACPVLGTARSSVWLESSG